MALLFMDGFDQYDDDAEIARGGWSATSFAIFASSALNRHGDSSRSIQITAANSPVGHFLPASDSTIICGFAFYNVSSGSQSHDMIRFYNAGTEQLVLRMVSGGNLAVDRGSTQLGITTGGLVNSQAVWYHIAVKIFMHGSTGTVDVEVDGANVLALTSQNTLNTIAVIDRFFIQGHSTSDPVFDDLYVADGSGSDLTDFAGDCRIETLVPDGAGDSTDWTPSTGSNWENVDDMAPPDDDSTYNHTATAADDDLYDFGALSGSVGEVFGVAVSILARKEDPGYREIKHLARNNVTTVAGDAKTIASNYGYKDYIFENDPDGGGNWTETDVNSAQFGIRLET